MLSHLMVAIGISHALPKGVMKQFEPNFLVGPGLLEIQFI